MIYVKTKVKNSTVSGKGIFADQDIPKGTLIWKADPAEEIYLTSRQYEFIRKFIGKKCFENFITYPHHEANSKHMNMKDVYVLHTNDMRFMNHSTNPNTMTDKKEQMFALRDIKRGEELTENYLTTYTKKAPCALFLHTNKHKQK